MDSLDKLTSVNALIEALKAHNYLADQGIATAIFLALKLQKPLLLEGVPGCGKTEVARTLAPMLRTDLIRLQCYEGIDTHQALYEWDYARQLLNIRLNQEKESVATIENAIYSEKFLLERPLLKSLRQNKNPVLLIDELDRADADFEAFLLEFLEEFQVTIPELGSIKAVHNPIVIITSNRTRDLHDALKRRCLYHWVDLPSEEVEEQIIKMRLPGIDQALSKNITYAVARMREMNLVKYPGTSESIDWARSLTILSGDRALGPQDYVATLSAVLKDKSDIAQVSKDIEKVLIPS